MSAEIRRLKFMWDKDAHKAAREALMRDTDNEVKEALENDIEFLRVRREMEDILTDAIFRYTEIRRKRSIFRWYYRWRDGE
jgi:hypothetical protein